MEVGTSSVTLGDGVYQDALIDAMSMGTWDRLLNFVYIGCMTFEIPRPVLIPGLVLV
jgi:hypothetical protein